MPNLPNISPELIKAYRNEIARRSSPATAKRKDSSLNKFLGWAEKEGHIQENPLANSEQTFQPVLQIPEYQETQTEKTGKNASKNIKGAKNWFSGRKILAGGSIVALIVLILLLVNKLQLPIPFRPAPAQEANIPNVEPQTNNPVALSAWGLYAKLTLKDKTGTPVTKSQPVTFKLYKSEDDTKALYTGTKTITPDSNGNSLIYLDDVPRDLFFQNQQLYLATEISGTETDKRFPISTANESANLQGFYPAKEAGPNSIPVLSDDGSLLLAAEAPSIKATSGNLSVEGQALTLKTADASGGDITFNPDGSGIAHFLFEGSNGNFLNAQAANLTSGSLYYGIVANDATGYDLVKLQSGSTPTTKFEVDSSGNTNIARDLSTANSVRLTAEGGLENITSYDQTSGNFSIDQSAGNSASISKNDRALSDVLNLTLDERGKGNSSYSTLVLNRYDGAPEAMALLVDNGNAQFNGQVRLGRYVSNPTAIGTGTLVYNSTDNQVYVWDGSTWQAVGTAVSTPFSTISSGTNTSAAMVVGSGASLDFTGTGTINASTLNSVASTSFLRSDTSDAFTSGTLTTNAGTTFDIEGGFQVGGAAGSSGQLLTSAGSGSAPTWTNIGSIVTSGTDISVSGTTSVSIDNTSTLSSVTGRGASTATQVSLNGGITSSSDLTIAPTGDIQFYSSANNIDSSGNLTIAGTTTFGGKTYTWPGSIGANDYILQTQTDGTLAWVDPVAVIASQVYWDQAAGLLSPKNNSVDLTIGGNSTESAKFAFINVNDGVPTASIAGTTAYVATYLTGEGNLATTNSAPLTLGNTSSSGNVQFFSSSNNIDSSGNLTIAGNLDVNGTTSDIAGTLNLSGGALTSTGALTVTPQAGSNFNVDLSTTGDLAVNTNQLYVDTSAARVGVGTTTPDATFHVVGGDAYVAPDAGYSFDNPSANEDLYVYGNLEVDGTIYGNVSGTINPGFTTGSIIFQGPSGLAEDNANFFYDNTYAKLGLGTNSPTSKLQVTGAITGKALAIFDETGDQNIITASAGGVPKLSITHSGSLEFYQASSITTSTGNLTLDSGSDTLNLNTSGNGAITTGTGQITLAGNVNATNGVDITGANLTVGTTNFTVDPGTGNVTTAGTVTLPNSNTLTGVSSYTQFSNGVSVGGATTYYLSSSGDLNANAGTFAGTLTANGDTVLGNATSDTVTYTARVNSNIIPSTDDSYDLGSSSLKWANVYATNFVGTISPGFTEGSVVFTDGSGNLAQDNANFFWDDTSNKLGIGTNSPIGKLTVQGAVTGKALAVLDETGNQNILTASASGVNVANLDRSGNLAIEGSISDLSGSSLVVNDNLQINGNNIFDSGSANRIQLGSTINLSGDVAVSQAFSADGNTTLGDSLTLDTVTYNARVVTDIEPKADDTYNLGSASLKWANIYATNVVGTITPGFTEGSVVFTDGSGNLAQDNANFYFDDTNDKLGIGTNSPIGKLTVQGAVTGKALAVLDETGNQDVLAASAGGATVARITNSGNIYLTGTLNTVSGNLSIDSAGGQTTIADDAVITGTTTLGGKTYTWPGSIGANDYILQTQTDGTLAWVDPALAAASSIFWTQDTGLLYPKNTTADVAIGGSSTDSAKFAFINVIGSGVPTASVSAGIDGATYLTADGTIATTARQPLTLGASASSGDIQFFSSSNTVDTSGNLTLAGLLDVNGGGTSDIAGTLNLSGGALTSTGALTVTPQAGNNFNIALSTTGDLAVNTDQLYVETSTGYVGIGTTPSYLLDVSGSGGELAYDADSASILRLRRNGTNTIYADQAGGQLAFNTGGNATARVLIDYTGKVGIGNETPTAKLDVNGAVTGKALTILNETGDQAIFTASAGSQTKFTIANNGDLTSVASAVNLTGTGGISVTPSSALTFGSTGQNLTLQGDVTNITSNGAGNDVTLTAADNIFFDDTRTGAIPFSSSDTALTTPTNAVVDAINEAYNAAIGGSGGVWTRDAGTGTVYPTTLNDKVGIGTTTPANIGSKLFVTNDGTATGQALAIFDQTENQDIFTASSASTPVLTLSNAGTLTFHQASTIQSINYGSGLDDTLTLRGNYVKIQGNGGQEVISASPGEVAINDPGNTTNFRVEGASDQNLIYTDAATDTVGIGTNVPSEKLDVSGNATVSGNLTFYGGARTIAGRSAADLTLGDIETGNINFYSSSNSIDASGNLTLAGDITLTSGGTIASTANGNITLDTGSGTLNLNTTGNGDITTGTGQITLAGNINATNGLDVTTANLTVGGANFSVDQSNGDITTAGNLAVNGGNITSSGALNITPGGTLTVGATGQDLTLQGAVTNITSNGAGNDITLTAADNIYFDDTRTGAIPFSASDTTLTTPTNAIVDAINEAYSAATGASGQWTLDSANGVLFPNNNTTDVLIGGSATTSAKFAFLNVNSARGSQVASISGNLVLDNTGSIQTTKSQALTIGGDKTGNITLTPQNGSGYVTLDSNSLRSTASTFNLVNTSPTTTVNFAENATTINIGAITGSTTIRNATLVTNGVIDVNGAGTSDIAGTLNLSGNSLTSGGDLTINPGGGQLILSDTDTLNVGGKTNVGYNVFANSGDAPSSGVISADNDLFVGGDFEAGNIYTTTGGAINPGFTEGSVVFIGSSGELAQDNANFFWDNTAKSLIFGGDANLYRSSANVLTTDDTLNAVAALQTGGTFEALRNSAVPQRFYISTANDANVPVLYVDSNGQITLNSQGAQAIRFNYDKGTGGIIFGDGAGAQAAEIDTSGNISGAGALQIGANTNSVNYSRLSSSATTDHTLSASDDLLIGGSLELDSTLFLDNGIIANSAGTTTVSFTATPTTGQNTLGGTSWLVENGANLGLAALTVNQTKGGDIFTASAGGSPQFVIDNSGQVGIGTNTPSLPLDVVGPTTGGWAGRITIDTTATTGLAAALDVVADSTGTITDGFGSGITFSINGNGSSLNYIGGVYAARSGADNSGELRFLTNNAGTYNVKMTIDKSGNVGIGDTTPDHLLDVAGNIGLNASSYINFGDTDGTSGYGFRDNSGSIEFKNSGGSWTGIGSGSGGGQWTLGSGVLYPNNNTADVLIGDSATSSAKFAFTNINSGTPQLLIYGAGTVPNYLTQGAGNNFQINTNVDAANNIGDTSKAQWKMILGASLDEWSLRRSPAGVSYSESTLLQVDSSGDLRLNSGVLQVGNAAAVAYNRIGTTGATHTGGISSANDLLVNGDFELDGNFYLDGNQMANDAGNVFLVTCQGDATCSSASTFQNVLAAGSWIVDNDTNVGKAALTVINEYGGDLFTASASATTRFYIKNDGSTFIDGSASTLFTVGGGSGKVDIGTVDPVYQIGGTKYATYLSGMTGVKEETTGNVTTDEFVPGVGYRHTIDFKTDNKGSDIWLFAKATDIAQHINDLVVLLSGSGNTKTWYEVNPDQYTVSIYTSRPTTVSYRLTAPRFDSSLWTNYNNNPGSSGFQLPDTPISVVDNGYISPANENYINGVTVNPIATSDAFFNNSSTPHYGIADSLGNVIQDISTAYKFVAANIKAGAIETKYIAADSLYTGQATIDNLLINSGLVTPIVKTKTISPLANESDIDIQIGNNNKDNGYGKLNIKNASGSAVASVDTQGNATFSGELSANEVKTNDITAGKIYADEIIARNGKFGDLASASSSAVTLDQINELLKQAEVDQQTLASTTNSNVFTATNSATLDTLTASDLYITQQAAINSLSVTSSFTVGTDLAIQSQLINGIQTNSIDTLSAPLQIQSLALAPVEIMSGLVTINTNGDVNIQGNLYVAGKIDTSAIALNQNKDLGIDKLFSINDATGSAVATIDASGSANFKSINTDKLVVAGSNTATASAITNGQIQTNGTAGDAVLPANTTDLRINNPNVNSYTLVYVTPTSPTSNNVLYVKSKGDGYFIVGFSSPITQEVSFNWWLVDVKQ